MSTPQTLSETYQQAKAYHRQGRLSEARTLYLQVLHASPGHPQVLHQLGVIAYQSEDLGEAILLIQQAISLSPSVATFHNNLGNALKKRGNQKQAEASYREAVRLNPDYAMARLNLARFRLERGDATEAEEICRNMLQTTPVLGAVYCVLGEILATENKSVEAKKAFKQAIAAQPDLADAYVGLGHLHRQEQDPIAAVEAFQQAVRPQPEQVSGYQNLGSLYLLQNRLEEAERCFRRAFALAPSDFGVRYNLGTALRGLGKRTEAKSHLEAVIEAQPDTISALYELTQLRSGVCDWTTHDQDLRQLVETTQRFLEENVEQRVPLLFLQRYDLPPDVWTGLVRQQAGVIERAVAPLKPPVVSPSVSPDRLKIGYVSPDFRAHAVGLLVHRMFGLHDRSAFEIYGYTLTNPDHYASDTYYQQIREGCDAFVNLSEMSVAAAAEQIASDGIHILIDLAGHTTFSRPELLALRPAPVQAHYLGFLDTMAADFLPYLIADEEVIPSTLKDRYTEHVVYMPETFAVASPFEIDPTPVSRTDCNLPEDGIAFCCFNHAYKIDPEMFDTWATILKAVPDSVLWLYDSGVEEAETNLRREALARGISENRLVFAPHAPIEQHLSRCRLADLFLDTFVYNAGTTGVLALWAGLPVLTRPGKRFLNRMGASLAKAVGLPELICENTDAYVTKAVHLATHPEELAALRTRLWETRETQPLFQTERFVRHLETAYRRMWEQQMNGERADIRV